MSENPAIDVFSENALKVLQTRYFAKNDKGEVVEDLDGLIRRVSVSVAAGEPDPDRRAGLASEFGKMLRERRFLPNTPTLINAGRELGQLSACFVLPMGDSMEEIFDTVKNVALIQKSGGGTGISFSRLRPENSIVKSTGGRASGPISFMKVINAATDAVKQGGCLVPETLVFTKRGLLRLDEIVSVDGPEWQKIEEKVLTDDGWHGAYEGHVHGISECLSVELKNGARLTGTPEHKILVKIGESFEWKRFNEIRTGDLAVLPMGQASFPDEETLLRPLVGERHFNEITPSFPATLNDDLAFFFGYFYGNGHKDHTLTTKSIGWTVPDKRPDIKHKLRTFVECQFGLHVSSKSKADNASETFTVASTAFYDWLEINGFQKNRSYEIAVPRKIRQSPISVVGAFIRGYFEADGTLNDGHPIVTSTSRRFLEEIQTLLSGAGIYSVLHEIVQPQGTERNRFGDRPIYSLCVRTSEALKKFNQIVRWTRGIQSGRKNGDVRGEQHGCTDIGPDILLKTLDSIKGMYGYGVYRALYRAMSHFLDKDSPGFRNLTRGAMSRIVKHFGKILQGTALMEQWEAQKNVWFVPVKAVSAAGQVLTLDLSVENRHAYTANGVVSHNTRRGANMGILRVDHPDVLAFVDCKQDLSELTNFNISVAVTDAFMKALDNGSNYDLVDPSTGQTCGSLSAKMVWDKICANAWKTGEPGLFFIDTANKFNPTPSRGAYEATNPCTRGSSLVLTRRGLIPIRDLAGKEEEIWNGERWARATFWSTGMKPVYRLSLRNGFRYEGTLDHRLAETSGGEVSLEKSPVKTFAPFLGNGDWIGSRDLSEEEATAFGILLARGTRTAEGIRLSCPKRDSSILATVEEFAAKADLESRAKGSTTLIFDKKLEEKLESFGVSLSPLPVRSFPKKLLTQDPVIVEKFFNGLFSANGVVLRSTKGIRLVFKTASHDLAVGVQQALAALGLASSISVKRSGDFVVLSGSALDVFFKRIGFIQSYKNESLKEILDNNLHAGEKSPESKVASLEFLGEEEVFDFNEPDTHWGWISGFKSHNCGEQVLGPYESCTLGSINLERHVADGKIDWDSLAETTRLATVFLDDVVNVNKFPLEKLAEQNAGTRRIGLGVMGFARMLMKLGIPYDSEAGLATAETVMDEIRKEAMATSIDRGTRYGIFPFYEGVGPKRRNSHILSIAPTGTISMIADTSSGCEPEFALVWYKNVMDGTHLPYALQLFEDVAKKEGFWSEDLPQKIVENHGSCRGLSQVPEKWQKVFATAHDIAPEWHVRMQAAFQEYVDTAVSKTINLPATATVEDVDKAYRLAYTLGCKGITVYRDGSRQNQVLNVGTSGNKKEVAVTAENGEKLAWGTRRKSSGVISGGRIPVKSHHGKAYVHLYLDDEGTPQEIFVTPATGHEEKESAILLGRLGSLALQYGAPYRDVVSQFIKAHEEAGTMGSDVHMTVKALGQLYEELSAKAGRTPEVVEALKCPECRIGRLSFQEGCQKCTTCGFSKC